MLRKLFVKDNIHAQEIKHIIGHNSSIFFPIAIKTILLLVIVYIIYIIIHKNFHFNGLSIVFGFIGILLLARFIIKFLNLYFDSLILSPEGITMYLWEGLLEYKTEYFDWSKIVTVNHRQKGLLDKIFGRGDLVLNLEQGIQFPFENISRPKKQVDILMRLKQFYQIHKNTPQKSEPDLKDPGLDVVMEAFSEIVKDYISKKNTDNEDDKKVEDYKDIY